MSDPLERLPDQAKRYRVLGVTRGTLIYVEIFDEVEKQGVVLTFPEALTVVADINLEIARIFGELVTHLDRDDAGPGGRRNTVLVAIMQDEGWRDAEAGYLV
jgi:hypothetical protein